MGPWMIVRQQLSCPSQAASAEPRAPDSLLQTPVSTVLSQTQKTPLGRTSCTSIRNQTATSHTWIRTLRARFRGTQRGLMKRWAPTAASCHAPSNLLRAPMDRTELSELRMLAPATAITATVWIRTKQHRAGGL